MLIKHFQPIKGYLWTIVAKIIVDSAVKKQPYQGVEKPQTGMVSIDVFMESLRALLLDSKRGLIASHQ